MSKIKLLYMDLDKISAQEVADYFLLFSLENHSKRYPKAYFRSDDLEDVDRRLNKMLHMAQIFHCVKYGKPLFREKMMACDDGVFVPNIKISLPFSDLTTNLDEETKNFIGKIFSYFCEYKCENLCRFSRQDPA